MPTNKIRNKVDNLCRENDWFTCGNEYHYQKMLDLAESGNSIHEMAFIIYLCSQGVAIDDIECQLSKLYEGGN